MPWAEKNGILFFLSVFDRWLKKVLLFYKALKGICDSDKGSDTLTV